MKNNAIKWLYAVPEKKKLYILALMLVQGLHGASGVLYASAPAEYRGQRHSS